MKQRNYDLAVELNPQIERFLTSLFNTLELRLQGDALSNMKPREILAISACLVNIHKVINSSPGKQIDKKSSKLSKLEELLSQPLPPEELRALSGILDKLDDEERNS